MNELNFIKEIAGLVAKYESPLLNSVRIAQSALESDFGRSELAIKAKNLFGIKASAPWTGDVYNKDTGEHIAGKNIVVNAGFRDYESWEGSVKDHATFIVSTEARKEIYADAINGKTPEAQAKGLTGTYATDPKYNQKLLRIIEQYHLTQYDKKDDTKKERVKMAITKPQIIDRRTQALGYPGHGAYAKRSKSAIKYIVWHYTATTHQGYGADVIKAHEGYWRNTHGWDIGGYHYYIDRAGNIFWNYDLEIVSYGAGKVNPAAMHISLEASDQSNYTQAQLQAREQLTLWLMKEVLPHLGGNNLKGHLEFMSTSCPGYSIAQLNAFRKDIGTKLDNDWGSESNASEGVEIAKNGKYVVKHGDTLWAIAKAHDVTVDQLREWNSIQKGQWLKTDQVIYVVEPKLNAYTVKKGDYLHKIATEYGVTVDQIKEWNDLKSNFIYTGQELFVSDPSEEIEVIEDAPSVDDEPTSENGEVVDEVEDEGHETPAIELKENQLLTHDGKIIEYKIVE